ncbi:MAG: tetratricopeptide repeat protein [Gemmataceae bacterium]
MLAPVGSVDYVSQAVSLFRSGQYLEAVSAYRHAAVDQPQNADLAVQAAFALIGAGKLDEAAGAAQQGLSQLPPEQWAGVAKQAGELFPSQAAYDQAALAAARASDKALADPGTRFATGLIAFGRGEMTRAASDFDAVLKAAPQDAITKKLRELTGVR